MKLQVLGIDAQVCQGCIKEAAKQGRDLDIALGLPGPRACHSGYITVHYKVQTKSDKERRCSDGSGGDCIILPGQDYINIKGNFASNFCIPHITQLLDHFRRPDYLTRQIPLHPQQGTDRFGRPDVGKKGKPRQVKAYFVKMDRVKKATECILTPTHWMPKGTPMLLLKSNERLQTGRISLPALHYVEFALIKSGLMPYPAQPLLVPRPE